MNKETNMRAYKGDPELKAALLVEIEKHRLQDMLVRGTYGEPGRYGEGWRGCAIACSLRSLDIVRGRPLAAEYKAHARYPDELDIPIQLAFLEDRIFEGLSPAEAMAWPERFARAIEPGADLSLVWPRFSLWLLEEEGSAISAVARLFQRWVDSGVQPPLGEWDAAGAAAYYDRVALESAAAAAAARASHACDAADAYADAAEADAADYAEADFRAADAWTRMADKLVELLSAEMGS